MRIVHSADWHLGAVSWKSQKAIDRLEEQKEVLEHFLERVRSIDPDAVILAGDLLHHRTSPSVRSLKLLFQTLNELKEICPVIVVLGNHDWEGLAVQDVFKIKDLHIFNGFTPRRIDTDSGKLGVYPVPYVSGAMDLIGGRGKTLEALLEKLNSYRSRMLRDSADFNVLIAHIMISGRLPQYAEDRLNVVLDTEHIPAVFDYVALGHVHEFTEVSTVPLTYYSGSIIQLDFSELKSKGFIVLEDGKVEFVELPHKRLSVVRFEKPCPEIDSCLKAVEEEDADYVKVVLSRNLSRFAGRFLGIDKVVSVEILREDSKVHEERRVRTFDFKELLEEYVRLNLDGDSAVKAMEYLRKVLEDIRA